MIRRSHLHQVTRLAAAALAVVAVATNVPAESVPVHLDIERSTAAEGTAEFDWMQARAAYVPGQHHYIMTASPTAKAGAHGYQDIHAFTSTDGVHWSAPEVVPTLRRQTQPDGYEVAPGDLCPGYIAKYDKVLATGKTFNFAGGTKENYLREKVSYVVMDPKSGEWGPLRIMEMPARDHSGAEILAPNAGCHQRVDLPNGDVLLPVRYQRTADKRNYTTLVARCHFDGETLTYVEHGSEHNIAQGRGLYEPSVWEFEGSYYLTIRSDKSAWVCKGTDGIHFGEAVEWTFDDGQILGSYNTQQHWVTVGDGLFLIYTRKGANNDHIMRHRAPLFVGQVDPEKLVVVRSTEQILLPENDATLGNSGVCQINPNEVLITCGEGAVSAGKRKGENNKILTARVHPR